MVRGMSRKRKALDTNEADITLEEQAGIVDDMDARLLDILEQADRELSKILDKLERLIGEEKKTQ